MISFLPVTTLTRHSKKMLNDRLRKWNRGKNIKSQEMANIATQLQARDLAHKRSEIRARGRFVSVAKVKRYRKMTASKLLCGLDGIESRIWPEIVFRTPPASPPATPRSLKLPEELFMCLKNYMLGAVGEKIWVSVGDLEDLVGSWREDSYAAVDFAIHVNMAIKFFDSSGFSNAKRFLHKAEEAFESAVKSQQAQLVCNFLSQIWNCIHYGHSKLILPTMEHFSAMAVQLLKRDHPLARSINLIYLLLKESKHTALLAGLESAWLTAIDSLELVLDPLHFSLLNFRLAYIRDVITHRDPQHGISLLRQLLHSCDEKCCSLKDIRPLRVRCVLAFCLADTQCRQYEEAVVIANEIIEAIRHPSFPSAWIAFYRGEAYYLSGISQIGLGQSTIAEKDMRKAIRIRLTAFRAQDARALRFKTILEDRLRIWGKVKAADELKEDLLASLERTPNDDDADAADEGGSSRFDEKGLETHDEESSDVPNAIELDEEA